MGSLTLPKLPVIDFSKETLKPGTSSWFSKCNDVRGALEEYGCFTAVYDGVSSELHKTIFGEMEVLFDLPTETKMKNTSDKPYHGHAKYPILPLAEGLHIEDATSLEKAQSFTNLMWPAGNDRFCETAHLFTKLVVELNKLVIRMVFESYGVEKCYESHVGSTDYLLKFIKYRVPQMNETDVGVFPHTDKSFTSILHQNQVNGLEIETKDGEWIGFESSPSSFFVMAGDAFLAWSNGRIHSATHRVTMNQNKDRYSLGLFSLIGRGTIQTPQELVDEEHPLQFKPFDHLGLLHFLATEDGRKGAGSIVKAYCGV